jgi:hypothetical protein
MQPTYISVGVLFGHGVRHTVPLFQRPYVWNLEDQWQPLWEDIAGLLERIECSVNGAPVAGHFLGTVVLEQSPNITGSLPRREVIDGQQRLTTLQILLKAAEHTLHAVVAQVEDTSKRLVDAAYRQISSLTINPGWIEDEEQYKVWPTNEDRGPFMAVMNSSATDDWSRPETQMAHAYTFFRETFQTYLSGTDLVVRVQRLATALKDHLRLIVLDLDANDEPQAIFETLNAHGTPLLPADLIKNWLLWEANRQRLDAAKLYDAYWKPFDRDHSYWRKTVGVGHAARARVDTFLQNWLTKETLEAVSAKHLYDKFLRYVGKLKANSPEGKLDLDTLMSDIHADATRYQRIEDASGATRFDEFLRRLAVLDVIVFHPLILAIMGRPGITPAELDEVGIALESYLVRRMVCGFQTRGYGTLALSLTKQLNMFDGHSVSPVVKQYLVDESKSNAWPSDAVFHEEWVHRRFYKTLRRERVIMLLQAIEEEYQRQASPKTEPILKFDFSQLTIEHVLPQNWAEHWPLDTGESVEQRDQILHGIGNLTLVSGQLNPALSNAPWLPSSHSNGKCKRTALEEHSKLELNRLLLKTHDQWDKTAIPLRAEELFKQARAIWPM